MQPITFECRLVIPHPATVICASIADTTRWNEFKGYGVMPGIKHATYEKRTPNMVGSRIKVQNTDGSQHVEEIYAWVPGEAVGMKLCEFTPPLSQLASHFTEDWRFQPQPNATLVTRRFQLFPKSALTRPLLWVISLLFRRAIAHHLQQMAAAR